MTIADSSDSESDGESGLIKVIQNTHKENIQNKDAKAVASMVETFLIDNKKIIPDFRKEICKLIVKFEDLKSKYSSDNE